MKVENLTKEQLREICEILLDANITEMTSNGPNQQYGIIADGVKYQLSPERPYTLHLYEVDPPEDEEMLDIFYDLNDAKMIVGILNQLN